MKKMQAGTIDPGSVLILMSAYKNEDNMAVWDAIEQTLGGLSTLLRGTDFEAPLAKFVSQLIAERVKVLGWEESSSDGHLDKLSRAILVRLQARFQPNDAEVAAKCKDLMNSYLAEPNGNSVSADLKQPVLRVVGLLFGRKALLIFSFMLMFMLRSDFCRA